jgi:hypothetical protein
LGPDTQRYCTQLIQAVTLQEKPVAKELENNNWIYAIRRISTREELLDYIKLWGLLSNVNLNNTISDSVVWKWQADDTYSSASAYKIQFQGSTPPFKIGNLWKAKIKPKVKVFSWTAMHQKILTADNLDTRGMQHCPSCPLCNQAQDARHLLINCPFSKEVLRLVQAWYNMAGTASSCSVDEDPASWLCSNVRKGMAGNQVRSVGDPPLCVVECVEGKK